MSCVLFTGIGLFTNGESIASWHPATDEIKEACKEAANYCDSQGVDIARLALRYLVFNFCNNRAIIRPVNSSNFAVIKLMLTSIQLSNFWKSIMKR